MCKIVSMTVEVPRLARGVSLVDLASHRDARGELIAFDPAANMPFDLHRVFVIKADDPRARRGGHANSCHELIVALQGSVRVDCDTGDERTTVDLRDHRRALWIEPGIIIHLSAFAAGTVLLVCASQAYADTRHFLTARAEAAYGSP